MLAHGAEYDMETGDLIVDEKKETPIPRKQILDALADAREGKFIPDRENDELTKVCYNYIFVSFRVYDNHADQL
jgi:nitrite reductase/ring-hydroxylating ferredoxin subunit